MTNRRVANEWRQRGVHVRPERAGQVVTVSSTDVVHRTAYRSWWDGHIVGLCGATAPRGEWENAWVIWWGERRCPECERIHRDRGQ